MMSLPRRRRFAYGYLALMVLASIAYLAWVLAWARPPLLGVPIWLLPLLTVFPVITVVAVERESAAVEAGRPLAGPSPRARRWMLGSALLAFVFLLALGLMLVRSSPSA